MRLPLNYYDTPFIYVKTYIQNTVWSAGHPVVPLVVQNDLVQSQGDAEFHLRRYKIVCANSGGVDQYQLLNAASQQLFSLPTGIPTASVNRAGVTDTPLVPASIYPIGSGIPHQFAVYDMLSIGSLETTFANVDGVHEDITNQLQFAYQGVKRWYTPPNYTADYKYYLKEYSYVYTFNLNWYYLNTPYDGTFRVAGPRTFYIPIQSYDFELMSIRSSIGPAADISGQVTGGYNAILYDANGNALSNGFVNMPYVLSSQGSLSGTGVLANNFPSPPLVYPRNSAIRIDVQSLASTILGGRGDTTIIFKGARRIPC